MIKDAFPEDQVEVWLLNTDAGLDWLQPFKERYGLTMPIIYQLGDEDYSRYQLGRDYHTLPPLYMVIDKQGIVRHRSTVQGSISIEELHDLIESLLSEE